jgi:hypothetical protein
MDALVDSRVTRNSTGVFSMRLITSYTLHEKGMIRTALEASKEYLWDGQIPKWKDERQFVCHAISLAHEKGKICDLHVILAQDYIETLLEGWTVVVDWLLAKCPAFKEYYEAFCVNTSPQREYHKAIQDYRQRWVKDMIANLEAEMIELGLQAAELKIREGMETQHA